MSFGTMIYKGKTGLESLRALLADFLNGTIDHFELCGHYAVIIYTRRHV